MVLLIYTLMGVSHEKAMWLDNMRYIPGVQGWFNIQKNK